MISVKQFRAKRLEVKVKQEVTVHLRHAAGKLDLTVVGPVTITATYPLPEKRRQRADHKESR